MKYLYLVMGIFMLASCVQDPHDTIFKVSGVVTYQNIPALGVDIELKKNNEVIKHTITNQDGYFEFNDVPESHYTIVTKKSFENGSFIENPTEVVVAEDTYLNNLILPEPVNLYPPVDYTSKTVTLTWSKYNHDNFYEYKLYRHTISGIDESTGKLIHIATSINDTVFIDNGSDLDYGLETNTTYYYRVYVNNEYGRLGGSNIQPVTTRSWDNEHNFTVFYNLELIANFSGMGGGVQGIDYDGQYYWLLEVYEQGTYYDTNLVQLIQYDQQSDEIIKKFEYTDEYAVPRSITWINDFIYIYYDLLQGPFIKKISSIDGSVVRTYSAEQSIMDMDSYGQYICLNNVSNLVKVFNISNFEYIKELSVPFGRGSNQGLACRDSEIWLVSRSNKQIVILDYNGVHIGVVDCSILSSWNGITHLCFMDDNLVLEKDSRIYIFRIYE